jgi:hypothetical protein
VQARTVEVDGYVLIKEERMPDGALKRILKDRLTGEVTQTMSSER